MADTMAPSCMELTFASAEARRKAPAARMKPAVARAAAAAETTASRPSRVRTSQFACGPPGSAAGASVPAPGCLAGTVRAGTVRRADRTGTIRAGAGGRGRYRDFVRQQRGGGADAPRRVSLRSGVMGRAVVISGLVSGRVLVRGIASPAEEVRGHENGDHHHQGRQDDFNMHFCSHPGGQWPTQP